MAPKGEPRRWAILAAAVVLATTGATVACSTADPEATGDSVAAATPAGPQPNVTVASTTAPRPGGTLAYGLEAETDGFNPTVNRWAISGTQVGLAIYDPLAALDADGQAQPYLAQSFEASPDFKTWTIKLRPGITFHDGTTLTAAAVKRTYEEHQASALTHFAVTPIDQITATDDLTAVVTMKTPWAVFPAALTSQLGVIPAPSMWDAPDKGGRAPVGTGPFRFQDWVPDKQLTVVKNPSYWRHDDRGHRLPYLDEVDFKPLPEVTARLNGLKSGQVDMMHTNDAASITEIRRAAADGTMQKIEDTGESEEGLVMLNTMAPPFDDLRARQAMAYATDTATYNQTVAYGALAPADNVFAPNSPWYVPVDYPSFDPAKARALVDQVKQDKGSFRFKFAGGGNDTLIQLQALQAMYSAVGMDVEIDVVEQASFIPLAVTGQFQAVVWRQFGSPDPDSDYMWWVSDNAAPIGQLALNMARNRDPEVDRGLNLGREHQSFDQRQPGYALVQQRLAADLPYIWLNHAQWVVAARNDVRNLTNGPLPDGQAALPIGGAGFPGVTRLTEVWLER